MSLSVQFLSLLAMIGTGIVAGAFMDMIGTATGHAGKKSFIRKHAVWFEGIGWVIAGCGTFFILFLVRDGAWRMYDPFAQISGLLLYASFFISHSVYLAESFCWSSLNRYGLLLGSSSRLFGKSFVSLSRLLYSFSHHLLNYSVSFLETSLIRERNEI